jgi:16S rRNA (cytosine1402-N4)-methyltransferase
MAMEVVDFLNVAEGGRYIDCTLGGGGHAFEILKRGGNVVGIDRDPEAVAYAGRRLEEFGDRIRTSTARFSRIATIVGEMVGAIDGVVMDLGVSSKMLDDPSRGFSYRHDGPLLMTMDDAGETAGSIVNTAGVHELTAIFRDFGEERHASRIARFIDVARAHHPIRTTGELAAIVEQAVGPRMPQKSKARVFQALRIYVNKEIDELVSGLDGAISVMRPGGRLCVISYHSIEDRTVKEFMRDRANPCICPPDLPVCRCGRTPTLKIVTRKPVKPSETETVTNSRAHSALLRVAEKL